MNKYQQTVYPVVWQQDKLRLIDQTKLPNEYNIVEISRYQDLARAIKMMIVRGAPAIGVAAAYGMYLGAREIKTTQKTIFLSELEEVAESLRQTRPTAVNLFWAIARLLKTAYETLGDVEEIKQTLLLTAQKIQTEDLATCKAIGEHGLAAMPSDPEQLRILTHCNTGSLATAGYGTALGVIRSAWASSRLAMVYAGETRPRLQGAKLTAWECAQENIPVTVITDSMAAHCLEKGLIDAVIVGADRIAANGDTANKIGTYALAVLSQYHHIPFFVAAPLSTVDFNLSQGQQIPIEAREDAEIYQIGNTKICPPGIQYYNPAFDVTPAHLITGIITEKGTVKPEELLNLQSSSLN